MFVCFEFLMLIVLLVVLVGCVIMDQGICMVGECLQEFNLIEVSLWYCMDEVEENLCSLGWVIDDFVLIGYVDVLVCWIVGEFCLDVWVYVVNNFGFNVMMVFNGMMVINLGFFLCVESEDELGFVIGYELVYYLENYVLEQYVVVCNVNIIVVVVGSVFLIGVVVVMGGVLGQGYFGSGVFIVIVLVYGGVYVYLCEWEFEVDCMGLQLVSVVGFDFKVGLKIWNDLFNELEVFDDNCCVVCVNCGGMFCIYLVIQVWIEVLEEEVVSMQGELVDLIVFCVAVVFFINDWLDVEIVLCDYGFIL